MVGLLEWLRGRWVRRREERRAAAGGAGGF
jgi:hypothetical protein